MSPLRSFKVFFAIPFDAATKSMYDTIIEDLRNSKFKDDFNFSLGTASVDNTKPDFSKLKELKTEEFKAQNQDFLTRFVHVIESSDIIVADLTSNNPSVHLELGIALTLNKNIFRVTGRNLIDIATDLQGYEINKYTCRQQLYDWLVGYLDYFLAIKQTSPTPIIYDWKNIGRDITGLDSANVKAELAKAIDRYYFYPVPINGRARDSEIRFRFKFIETFDNTDWLGVLLRNETANPWLGSGYFVFIRLDGQLEIHDVPTGDPPRKSKAYSPLVKNVEYVLRINIDGSHLWASLGDELENGIHVDNLEHQFPGNTYLLCYRSFVTFGSVDFSQHDAIALRIA